MSSYSETAKKNKRQWGFCVANDMKSTRENNVEKYLRGCERNLENPQTDRIFSKYIKRVHLKEETLKFSTLLVSVLH